MSGPGSTELVVRLVWPPTRRALGAIGLTVYGVLVAAGALSAPGPALAVGALLAVIGHALVAWLHRVPTDLPPLPHPAVAGAALASLPAAIAGTAALGATAGIVVGLGLVIGSAFAVHWVSLPPAGSHLPHPSRPDSVADEESLRELLRRLPLDVLEEEWRRTRDRRGPSRGARDALLRALLVDELLRRDPAGTGRWLVDDPEDPPGGTVGGRPA